MNKRTVALLLTLLLMLGLMITGCRKDTGSSSSAAATTSDTLPTLINVDVSKLLTVQQVGSALGVTVGEPQIYDSGTTAKYLSDDAKSSAEISLMECSRDKYNETIGYYSDASDTPNLGETAKWSAENKQLLVYGKGYMISVTADVDGKNKDALLTSARQLAALVLDKLG